MDNKEYLNAERAASWREALRKSKPNKDRINISRTEMNELTPDYRITCNEEVNQGLTREQALIEASRCLDCPDPLCITGCPVGINIPKFIKNIERGEILEAAKTLKETSALPAVCGRVCPQEKQCESKCFYLQKLKKQPVAIGYLERFAADYERESGQISTPEIPSRNGIKIAVVGSGPAGLSFAGDMIKKGYSVTVFEALHEIGGVLKYGIPEFRLPNRIVDVEIDSLRKMGVEFITDCIIGKTLSYEDLHEMGFKIAAMALDDNSVSIDDPQLVHEEKLAIVLGTEGDGLAANTIADCDYTVKIPMYHGVDSLNVAAASAVAFWEMRRR